MFTEDYRFTGPNVAISCIVIPMPLPGRGWWRRFYWALAWSLGRRGR